jgi:hypothetical protein
MISRAEERAEHPARKRNPRHCEILEVVLGPNRMERSLLVSHKADGLPDLHRIFQLRLNPRRFVRTLGSKESRGARALDARTELRADRLTVLRVLPSDVRPYSSRTPFLGDFVCQSDHLRPTLAGAQERQRLHGHGRL